MSIDIKILGPNDKSALGNVAPGVFDNQIQEHWSSEFLDDPRHHLSVAIDGERIVGFASAVHYIHPDKAPELWINGIAAASSQQSIGGGKELPGALLKVG